MTVSSRPRATTSNTRSEVKELDPRLSPTAVSPVHSIGLIKPVVSRTVRPQPLLYCTLQSSDRCLGSLSLGFEGVLFCNQHRILSGHSVETRTRGDSLDTAIPDTGPIAKTVGDEIRCVPLIHPPLAFGVIGRPTSQARSMDLERKMDDVGSQN